MPKFIKHFFILIVILVLLLAFSHSYSTLGISNITLFVGIGIDKGEDDELLVSFQFTDISPVSQSGSTETKTPTTYTISAPSIHSAINLMTTYTGKESTLSHCKVIVFSEEIAANDISSLVSTLINESQIRPSTNIIISKCSAKDYLENTSPIFDNLITKHYQTFVDSSKSTGYTADITISDFFSSLQSSTREPVAILGKLSNKNTPFNSKIQSYDGTENTGLAIFSDGNLVGELNETETLSYLATTNQINGFLITVPDPYSVDSTLDIYLTPDLSTKINVDFVNSTPIANLSYTFGGRIYSSSNTLDYLDDGVLDDLSQSCNAYLTAIFSDFLYKTSKELNSDICDLGQYSKRHFSTLTDFSNYSWKDNYQNIFFNMSVNTTVKSGYLLSEN